MTVVEHLPYLHDDAAREHFRDTMRGVLCAYEGQEGGEGPRDRGGRVTACVMVVTSEGESTNPKQLHNLFGEAFLSHALVHQVSLSQITRARVVRRVRGIARAEGRPEVGRAAETVRDLRHAIHLLQFGHREARSRGRSEVLSIQHAVGRVLYAKRDAGGELAFDPLSVVRDSPLSPSAFLAFVQHNCPPFFRDIDQLSETLDCLALCDVLDAPLGRGRGGEMVSALVGHSVAVSNRDPAGYSFRQLGKPEVWNLARRRGQEAGSEMQARMEAYRAQAGPAPPPEPIEQFE